MWFVVVVVVFTWWFVVLAAVGGCGLWLWFELCGLVVVVFMKIVVVVCPKTTNHRCGCEP